MSCALFFSFSFFFFFLLCLSAPFFVCFSFLSVCLLRVSLTHTAEKDVERWLCWSKYCLKKKVISLPCLKFPALWFSVEASPTYPLTTKLHSSSAEP